MYSTVVARFLEFELKLFQLLEGSEGCGEFHRF